MSLSMAKRGQRVRVVRINAGRGLQARLFGMGIIPGTELTVVAGGNRGPVVVAVGASKIVLGRGMAHRIEVTEASP